MSSAWAEIHSALTALRQHTSPLAWGTVPALAHFYELTKERDLQAEQPSAAERAELIG